jgi:hypothetical protein
MAVFIARGSEQDRRVTTLGAGALFAGLTGLTLALSVTACRERLRTIAGCQHARGAAGNHCCDRNLVRRDRTSDRDASGGFWCVPDHSGGCASGEQERRIWSACSAPRSFSGCRSNSISCDNCRLPPPDGLGAGETLA